MLLDTGFPSFGGEPHYPICASCKNLIVNPEDVTWLTTTPDIPDSKPEPYHAVCAKPLQSVLRALAALRRSHFN